VVKGFTYLFCTIIYFGKEWNSKNIFPNRILLKKTFAQNEEFDYSVKCFS